MDSKTIVAALHRHNAGSGYALAARVWVRLQRMQERRPTSHQLCGALFGRDYSNAQWHRVRRILAAFEKAGLVTRVPSSFPPRFTPNQLP